MAKMVFTKNDKVRMLVKGLSKWSIFSPGNYGKYQVTLLLDPENPEHAETIAKLEAWEKKAKARIKEELTKLPPKKREQFKFTSPFGEDLNQDYEPTGYYALKAKTTQPAVFDAKLKPVPLKPLSDGKLGLFLGQGAELALDVTLKFYASVDRVGYTAYLNAMQIIKKGVSSMQPMFSKIEDGYSVDEEIPTFDANTTTLEDVEEGDF